jgi:hypothetical protein
VADGPYSVILEQIRQRVAMRMAVLYCWPVERNMKEPKGGRIVDPAKDRWRARRLAAIASRA